MRRTVYQPEHEQFREVVREFLAHEVAPHAQAWEKAGIRYGLQAMCEGGGQANATILEVL